MNRYLSLAGMVLAVLAMSSGVNAASHTIIQSSRAFKPAAIDIVRGDTLDFVNQDEFIHQVYVVNGLVFDSPEQPPGNTIHITFPNSGTYEVRCHIHPKMLLTVHVK